MFDFICQMPGLDGSTAAWHGVVHLTLSAIVSAGGSLFLLLGAVSYRRSAAARRRELA